MAVQVNYNEMEWSSLDPDPSRSNDDSSHLREYARVLIAYDNHVDIYVNALLTGCEKCHRTDDRIAYCEYCPEHCDCLWISNIICRMQMIRVNVFYFSSHDCFNTDGWWCCWCGSCVLLFLSSNLYVECFVVFDWFAPALGPKRVWAKAKRNGKDTIEWTIHSHSSTPLTLDSHAN